MQIEKELFDKWADKYEKDIDLLQNKYPFAGYYANKDRIVDLIQQNNYTSILDMGVGTGLMLSLILDKVKIKYTGFDFSDKMIAFAQKRLNKEALFIHDIREDISTKLNEQTFDLIYSAYTFHHFNNQEKIELIQRYFSYLNNNGTFLIADISFNNEEDFNNVKKQAANRWDKEEEDGYFRKDDFIKLARENNIVIDYTKTSFCSGIYVLKKQ